MEETYGNGRRDAYIEEYGKDIAKIYSMLSCIQSDVTAMKTRDSDRRWIMGLVIPGAVALVVSVAVIFMERFV